MKHGEQFQLSVGTEPEPSKKPYVDPGDQPRRTKPARTEPVQPPEQMSLWDSESS